MIDRTWRIDRTRISEQVRKLRETEKRITDGYSPIFTTPELFSEAADAIESLSAKLADTERSAEGCRDGWIYCDGGNNLPEEKINPITKDFYEYQVAFKSDDVTDIRHYKFGRGHWWNGPEIMDKYVIAWRGYLDPHHERELSNNTQ